MMLKIPTYFTIFFVWMWVLLKILSLLPAKSDWTVALGATLLFAWVVVLGLLLETLET